MQPSHDPAANGQSERPTTTRRTLLQQGAALGTALGVAASVTPAMAAVRRGWFEVSLAQWSLHRTLQRPADKGGITNLDFPGFAKTTCGIDAIEYVNRFFATRGADGKETPRGTDFGYLEDLRGACNDAGVKSLLIMVDGEGQLADADDARRREAVSNHFKWVAAAAYLGCHSIRVNAGGGGEPAVQAERAADSLKRIARVSKDYGVSVLVENHGGLSSDGAWLASVMRLAGDEFVGTLPDFGNFYDYDRYQGVADLMPFAKAVSAKSYAFDESGNETKIDYERMLGIVKDAGYRGHVGIEYEGGDADEVKGIAQTKALLDRLRA